jgi:hypothetical protein
VLFLCCGCSGSYFFSFENAMDEWVEKGIDLDNPPIEWSIQRTQELARGGSVSVKFYLVNNNDKGKIWIERPFNLKPDCLYRVNVRYAFASADFGNVNHWNIITGVMEKQPQTVDEIISLTQGDTGNHSKTDVGYRWLRKSYNFTLRSSPDGKLYVIIGIWGVWETERTYYVDSIFVLFTEA